MKKHINSLMALSMAAMPAIAQTTDWQHFNVNNSNLPSNAVSSLETGDTGTWVGTQEGLAHYDGSEWATFTTANSALPSDNIKDIHIDADGAVWVATYAGLAVYRDRVWEVFTTGNSMLPTDLVRSVASDDEGNVWIGTWGEGLVKYSPTGWEVFHTLNSGLPSNGVYDVAVDALGRVWAGTHSGGVAMLENGNWTVFDPGNSELPHAHVLSIGFTDDGAIWFGTYQGLARLHLSGEVEWDVYTSAYFGHAVHAFRDMTNGTEGQTWFATDAGLLRMKDGNFNFLDTENSVLVSNNIAAVAADEEGNVYVGHSQKGLSQYNPDGIALPLYSDPPREIGVEIYPNPATHGLTVKIPLKGDVQYNLIVTDLSGRIVIDSQMMRGVAGQTLDVSTLPTGTYLLTIRSANEIASAPFVKR